MTREKMYELARELGYAEIAVENANAYDRNIANPEGQFLTDAIARLALARVTYDEAFDRWAQSGFEDSNEEESGA